MKELVLTSDLYNHLDSKCQEFYKKTDEFYDVTANDILFSYFNSTDDTFHVLNDWSEGKSNDPFWNDELNEHCAIVFIQSMCKELNSLKS